jgi:hypothetical protein
MINNIRKILKEEVENYMFFQNLQTIKKHVDMLLSKPQEEMDEILKKHDWASEHMSTAKDDIEEVCNFFTDGYIRESKNPCWKGYEQIGMKKKNGKEVPNCVPIEEEVIELGLDEGEKKGDCENRDLNKPWYTPDGPKKRSVCVKNDKNNVVKVNFGDPNMTIKKSDPERRKSFRARHNCENPGPKWKARYWSCKAW